ncbi:MAG: RidA family protein, partial [Desulfobacterales bacterium]
IGHYEIRERGPDRFKAFSQVFQGLTSHPHIPEEFANMPKDMEGQARETLENLRKGLESVGASFADLVVANRFLTDLSMQDTLNKIWNEYMGDNKPTTTTVQVVQLATDPRCLLEVNAIAVVD